VQSNLLRKNKKESTRKIQQISYTKHIKKNLNKHNILQKEYEKKIISDLIYDERKHIVAVFKEHLIWDDMAEFLIK
jgi:hypothetical protein